MLAKITMPKLWHNYDMTMPSVVHMQCPRGSLEPGHCGDAQEELWRGRALAGACTCCLPEGWSRGWEALRSTEKHWEAMAPQTDWRYLKIEMVSRCFKMFQDVSRCFNGLSFQKYDDVEICWIGLPEVQHSGFAEYRLNAGSVHLARGIQERPVTTINDHQNDHQNHKTSADPTGRRDHC